MKLKYSSKGSHWSLTAPAFSLALIMGIWFSSLRAQEAGTRTIPSRTIPVPSSASLQLQNAIRQSHQPTDVPPPPKTLDDWKRLTQPSASSEETNVRALIALRQRLGVTEVSEVIAGVRCYILTPKVISPRNRNRLVLNLHLGGFIWGRGELGTEWATHLASLFGYRVIVVDYRLLPEHPFPAALDDAGAVWKAITKSTKPKNVALVGGSVGGGLVLSVVQRAEAEGTALPGALVSVSPGAADLSKSGDTWFSLAGVDDIVYDGFWEGVFKFYAHGRDLKDPAVSPLYGDFNGFPPTHLLAGTRDIFLSDTVRVQRKLLQAGIPVQLIVVEGLTHGGAFRMDLPEVKESYTQIAQFLDTHLSY
jgi:epsilon-lactone hydrolase